MDDVGFISIHAPPRGATSWELSAFRAYEFQFTPLREGRRGLIVSPRYMQLISIHAPPRGATLH